MTIEIIDRQGVGWKDGKRTKQYPGYKPEWFPKSMRDLIKGADTRLDPSYWQRGSIHERGE